MAFRDGSLALFRDGFSRGLFDSSFRVGFFDGFSIAPRAAFSLAFLRWLFRNGFRWRLMAFRNGFSMAL